MPPGMGPGGAGAAGGGGMAPGGAGGGLANDASSPEYPVQQVVSKILAGEPGDLSEFISTKATGKLKQLREGKLSESQLERLKADLTDAQKQGQPKKLGAQHIVVMENKTTKKKVQFIVVSEGGKMVIKSMR
ncbi:MAG: hypothetical protein WD403_08190 [Pirellulales bacterium]